MMTSNPTWNANTPWDSSATQSQSQQQTQWNYNNSAMHPPPPSVSSQYNQFGFGSNSWSNQRTSLPSPNMNHQFLGINGSSTSGNF